ncbi:MAG: EAL domain-containing protein [Sedimenticola thiotaurini]|uniref:EAL domain-containing protein n=1 Tax=Sedimenticola thiotaurini TaxID=1543721 RepID=A0A558DH15_9GAMM|nr:MAG: EAL domain-containing protein [Sedimenticola thiotaurini]
MSNNPNTAPLADKPPCSNQPAHSISDGASPLQDTGFIITLGFLTILVLALATVSITIIQMGNANERVSHQVSLSSQKLELVYSMRDALQRQTGSLYNAMHETDLLLRSTEQRQLNQHLQTFFSHRDKFAALTLNPHERSLLLQMESSLQQIHPLTESMMEYLLVGAAEEKLQPLVAQVKVGQAIVSTHLNQLIELVKLNTNKAIQSGQVDYTNTESFLFWLTALLLLISLGIAYLVVRQTTERHQQIFHQATHDSLTHLINRQSFEQLINDAVITAQSDKKLHTLLYLDLDQFKVINDTCGHTAGDAMLRDLTAVINYCLRKGDTLARLGGDEFGILLRNCALEASTHVAEQLLEAIRNFRFTWGSKTFTVTASIGIYPIDRDTVNKTTALSAADAACYTAKDTGRNRYHIADAKNQELEQRFSEMSWVNRLTEALEQQKLCLYFQPITSLAEGNSSARHIEVLLRLKDEEGRIISPCAFLPAAERFGLINAIDRWVIDTTFNWMNHHARFDAHFGVISINLSGYSIGDYTLLKQITKRLKDAEFPPSAICFEITETAAITNIDRAEEFITSLRALGCRFALDDFGSGLSSFAYLKQLPVDYLKIDGSFVRDMISDPQDFAMVKAMIRVGQIMGKQTIAEFVECRTTADQLKSIGVNFIQGYYLGKPQPLTIRNLVRSNRYAQQLFAPAPILPHLQMGMDELVTA